MNVERIPGKDRRDGECVPNRRAVLPPIPPSAPVTMASRPLGCPECLPSERVESVPLSQCTCPLLVERKLPIIPALLWP